MIAAGLDLHAGSRLLAIGSHADDIEIGLGGTLLALLDRHPGLAMTWVVLSADEAREHEARASAAALRGRPRGGGRAVVQGVVLPVRRGEVKEFFDELGREIEPDLVFTHAATDLHQDHRLVAELTWNTFRDHLILEYEIPKYDGDLGAPNVFVPLSEEIVARKIALLLEHFPSQRGKHWFTEDLFRATMRLRGVESATPYAEAFRSRKLVVAA